MDIYDIYLELYDNLDDNLIGDIYYDDDLIKWEYDGLGKTEIDMDEHLNDVFKIDKDLIIKFLQENNLDNSFIINEPFWDESYVYFYITE